eukprot:150095-Hanusia_phi.AAC.1
MARPGEVRVLSCSRLLSLVAETVRVRRSVIPKFRVTRGLPNYLPLSDLIRKTVTIIKSGA